MKVEKIILSITKEDVLNFLELQNKVKICSVEINNSIAINGTYKVLGFDIKFSTELNIVKVNDNNVFFNIYNFNIFKLNLLNSISKKVFNYFINAFTEIDGISFEQDIFKVEIKTLLDKYYVEDNILNMKSTEILDAKIRTDVILLTIGNINVNTAQSKTSQNIDKPIEVSYTDEKSNNEDINYQKQSNISDDINEENIEFTVEEFKKYEKDFSEGSFFDKIKNYGKKAGVKIVYAALVLYYTYADKEVPIHIKAISIGALGYFILPVDIIPDVILGIGYADDFTAIITALKTIKPYINDNIKLKAMSKLKELFNEFDINDIKDINDLL